MNLIKRLFSRQYLYNDSQAVLKPSGLQENFINSNNNINFIVHHANGGYVLETRRYDRKIDENKTNLYIINDEKDLGEEIGKVITLELLRH